MICKILFIKIYGRTCDIQFNYVLRKKKFIFYLYTIYIMKMGMLSLINFTPTPRRLLESAA